MIRRGVKRFSLATNAERLRGDHAQTRKREFILKPSRLRSDFKPRSDPVENILIGKGRIIGMTLGRRGLIRRKDLERYVATIGLQMIIELPHPLSFEPAALAGGDQDRAFDVSRHPAETVLDKLRLDRRAPHQERSLMKVPDTAIAHRRCETVVK